VKLAYAEYFELVIDAIALERKLRGWSRAKKIPMMQGDWERLQKLAKRRGGD
jgi:putative endonuclease